ncbi:MAG: SsrA-binding protein SmpB [Bacteroidales bacterium]|nr:SsrA-binding protein SmpB [Bacteroidales bacterium]
MAAKKQQNPVNIKNRKAEFEYFLTTKYTAGIVLAGTEIKAIRAGKANLTDAYCLFIQNELWVRGLHVSEYKAGSYNNHEPKRDRKLLLTKKELRKIQSKLNEKGFTVIPTLLFISESGYAKLEIAVARGKKMYDKRETLKEKEYRRSLAYKEEVR